MFQTSTQVVNRMRFSETEFDNKRARYMLFKSGDKVLVLLLVPQNSLQETFFGPYNIEKKLSDLNYILHTPGQ